MRLFQRSVLAAVALAMMNGVGSAQAETTHQQAATAMSEAAGEVGDGTLAPGETRTVSYQSRNLGGRTELVVTRGIAPTYRSGPMPYSQNPDALVAASQAQTLARQAQRAAATPVPQPLPAQATSPAQTRAQPANGSTASSPVGSTPAGTQDLAKEVAILRGQVEDLNTDVNGIIDHEMAEDASR